MLYFYGWKWKAAASPDPRVGFNAVISHPDAGGFGYMAADLLIESATGKTLKPEIDGIEANRGNRVKLYNTDIL
jgi:hypothetical protein